MSGAGAARRSHTFVKPSGVGLVTKLVISTDRRVYHLQFESTARTAMASISWTYPEDALLALRGTANPAQEQTVSAGATTPVSHLGGVLTVGPLHSLFDEIGHRLLNFAIHS